MLIFEVAKIIKKINSLIIRKKKSFFPPFLKKFVYLHPH